MTDNTGFCLTRRGALVSGAAAASAATLPAALPADARPLPPEAPGATVPVSFTVNGRKRTLTLDPRVTLLDALREHLALTGSKKGCDHGQCGACTVMVEGKRINSCLTLAVMHDGDSITTIEGLGKPGDLHPMQAAFVRHDGYQCGYCTPGQIMAAVAMLQEVKDGVPSYVSPDLNAGSRLDAQEVRERMSGNICRCAAYSNIVAAIGDVAGAEDVA